MIYLAGPYSHPDHHVRCERFRALTELAARLLKIGINVYSPITHSHPMTEFLDLPTGWEFWERVDREYINRCELMLVATLDGWKQSVGVQAEIVIAKKLNIPWIQVQASDPAWYVKKMIESQLGRDLETTT